MNILILTTSFPCKRTGTIGGKFVLHEALAYAKSGASVKVLTPFFPGSNKRETLDFGVDVIRFSYFYPAKLQKLINPINPIYHKSNRLIKVLNIPFFILSFLWAVFKHSKNNHIVHCQWTTSVLFAMPFRRIRKYKIVTTARGSDIRIFPKWLNRFIMRKVDASINCYGKEWYQTLKQFPSNYIQLPLITNIKEVKTMPDDLSNIFKKNQEAFKIIYLGRFDEIKITNSGFPFLILIDSINILKDKGYNIQLVYIGWGSLFDKMKEKTKTLDLHNEIFFLGTKEKPEDYLPFFDLGLGGANTNAVCQEMSVAGLPQVAVNTTKSVATVPWKDKENMFLFTPHDVDSLTENIQFAMDHPHVRKKISENIKRDIKEFVLGYNEGGAAYIQAFKKLMAYEK